MYTWIVQIDVIPEILIFYTLTDTCLHEIPFS